jgi:hypothetical protein
MPKHRRRPAQRFPPVPLADVLKRSSKHRELVSDILSDFRKLDDLSALKIDLNKVEKKKAELRAALHRAASKEKLELATASDDANLYVFRRKPRTPDQL